HLAIVHADNLRSLHDLAREAANMQGDMVELGVYRGGSALAIRAGASAKTLHLFDTWKGLPHDDEDSPPVINSVECGHAKGEFACPLEECKSNLKDQRVEFHQ